MVWSGLFNFLGVLASTGAVAFTIITLLPVELILQVGWGAGFAMVFALLIAAIIWNLGTWWLGLPTSSSHTHDRLHYGRGPCQSADGTRTRRHLGRGLGAGHGGAESSAVQPVIGFVWLRSCCC